MKIKVNVINSNKQLEGIYFINSLPALFFFMLFFLCSSLNANQYLIITMIILSFISSVLIYLPFFLNSIVDIEDNKLRFKYANKEHIETDLKDIDSIDFNDNSKINSRFIETSIIKNGNVVIKFNIGRHLTDGAKYNFKKFTDEIENYNLRVGKPIILNNNVTKG